MKWYEEQRLALWERLYALLNGDDFDYSVYCRYLDLMIRRFQAGKVPRLRFVHFADSVKRCHEEHTDTLNRMQSLVKQQTQRAMN